jgi:23S rRNA (guanosine2251-2'-O)-methyltransferase
VVGEVGLEPTKAKPADLQSAPFATRDTLPAFAGAGLAALSPKAGETRVPYGGAVTGCQQRRAALWPAALAAWAQRGYARPMSFNKFPAKPKFDPDTGPVYLYGIHTVRAALDNPRRIKRTLLATANALLRLKEDGATTGKVPVKETTPKDLDRLLGAEAVHQGVALEVDPVERFGLDDLHAAKLVVILDQITDPHNVGAILRTACAFGADAVITTARYAPRETGVMAKAASGALDLVPLIEVRNLGDALEVLKQRGMTILGFDSEAPAQLRPRTDGTPLAIVLGAEGKGLRQKTRSLCDEVVRLDMPGAIKSLNVSNAAAIALFAATAGRG